MRRPEQIPKIFLATALCAAALFCGCGRRETAPASGGGQNSAVSTGATPAELPLDQQIEQKLDPLTREDVELYLKVMREAAERVKNPVSGDKAVLDRAKKILAGSTSGRVPTAEEVKTLQHANLVALSMDQIVAEEMKVDARAYRGIAEAVESVIPNPILPVSPKDSGPAASEHLPTPLEERLSAVNAANEKFLAPYREEIQRLIAIVRNPANLPK